MDRPTRPGQPAGGVLRRGTSSVTRAVAAMMSARGPGFQRLAQAHAWATAGDTLVALALAGTLFFQVPSSDEARSNVALYLLVTLAPFAVLGPMLGTIFARFPSAYRAGLMLSSAGRVGVVGGMFLVGLESISLYPLAFLLLVFSRVHGIARASLLPVVLDRPVALVGANARIARIGLLSSAAIVPLGAGALYIGSWLALLFSGACFAAATGAARKVPSVSPELLGYKARTTGWGFSRGRVPRPVRLARFATAGVRLMNGFLLLLVAFAFRDQDAGFFDFGALLGAAGLGFFMAAVLSPILGRRLREEPMVLAALAVEAAAAFIAGQAFGLGAAVALAWAAGFAWGTAKFGFDGLLQSAVEPALRGVAFTMSETLFQLAWVVGAIIPVAVTIPEEVGLSLAGVAALGAQVVYVAGLVLPVAEARASAAENATEEPSPPPVPPPRDVSEFL